MKLYNITFLSVIIDVPIDNGKSNGYVLLSVFATPIRKDDHGAGVEFHELTESQKQKLEDAEFQVT